MIEDKLLTAAQLADAVGVSLYTVYAWERRGLIHARTSDPKRYSLLEVREAKAPLGMVSCPIGAERIGVSSAQLHAWARKGQIPPVTLLRPRYAVMQEADVPRVKAWHVWRMTADYHYAEYDAAYDYSLPFQSVASFERAIEQGLIPERYSPAHYDLKGTRQ